MILDDISFKKIEERLYELDKEINKAEVFEKEKKELIVYRAVVEQYRGEKMRVASPLATAQSKHALKFFEKFPYLSLHKGEQMLQKELSRYNDENSEDIYHGADERDLRASGVAARIAAYLRQFCGEEPKNKNLPDDVRARRDGEDIEEV